MSVQSQKQTSPAIFDHFGGQHLEHQKTLSSIEDNASILASWGAISDETIDPLSCCGGACQLIARWRSAKRTTDHWFFEQPFPARFRSRA
jgi:hypothetical protein